MSSSKTKYLFVCLIFIFGCFTSVIAITDAELEAMERQIEQIEIEESQNKARAEAKQKAEQKRKLEAKKAKKRHAELAQKKKEDELIRREAKQCAPRILPPNPSAFPDISQLIYNNPAFQNSPAPKVKWSKHNQNFEQDTDEFSSRSYGKIKKTYHANDGAVRKINYESSSDFSYTHNSDSQYNSNSQSSNSSNYQSILLGLISIKGEGEYTNGDGVTSTSSSKATIINVEGKLFPLKRGNKISLEYKLDYPPYKSEYKVEYYVEEMIRAESLNMGLTCKVFVILEQKETHTIKVGGDFDNTSTSKYKHYFSEQLGIVIKGMPLDVDYKQETVLVDYELLPEFNIQQLNSESPTADVSKIKRQQSADPEKRKAEVALRLKTKDPEGDWVLDSKTGCAMWNSIPEPDDSFTWSGKCFDGMLSGKGTSQIYIKGKKTATIKGEYTDGTLNGHGTKSWINGDSYEGEFLDGYRTGHGVYKWSSGDRYDGTWKDNLRHGYGIQSWVSLNQQFEGLWENDKPAKDN
jgi:hypothetical protein